MTTMVRIPLLIVLCRCWIVLNIGYYRTNVVADNTTTTANTTDCTVANNTNDDNKPPVQVYILAGQSNMVGMGSITHLDRLIQYNGTIADRDSNNSYSNEYRDTLWNGTNYKERDDVYILYQTNHGKLTVSRTAGYAGGTDQFGPEVLFGWTMAEQQQRQQQQDEGTTNQSNMILLIKVAYGGRDLAIDFRPPSAGIGNYSNVNDPDHYGWEYRVMINDTKRALSTIEQYIPNYMEEYNSTYQLKGFVWFQGWNDLLSWPKVNEYESNLAHLIRDIRTELNHSDLPFVIGELGMHGLNPGGREAGRVYAMRAAQQNVCQYAEFQNNTIFVPTALYAVLNGTTYNGIHHYYGRADTYFHIGQAFGVAMNRILVQNELTLPLPDAGTFVATSRARRTSHFCQSIQCFFALPLLLSFLL